MIVSDKIKCSTITGPGELQCRLDRSDVIPQMDFARGTTLISPDCDPDPLERIATPLNALNTRLL